MIKPKFQANRGTACTNSLVTKIKAFSKEKNNTVALVAFACCFLVTGVWLITRPAIEASERNWLEQQLQAVLEEVQFDNSPGTDIKSLKTNSNDIKIYRARLNGIPTAAIYDTVTGAGYSGAIRMLIGVDTNREITGVRIVSHRETPGLGDAIEISKSDWIRGFNNISLQKLRPEQWRVKKDGGRFDQFTGATITPRAVVNAIHETLQLHSKLGNEAFE